LDAEKLPRNGIYFFYGDGENSGGHGSGGSGGSNQPDLSPTVPRQPRIK